ncbi:2-amino-4-hydroxy-6-hydroxymethyldihydropteridine diphosphokinase [Evansella vedderi]|uniref:2-amino-4-hydroxy-6-hydroxymethyldihydropteridine diphosphokinase n=1 Tax=Evansella vedderi TaxID=38282 RepID=A0ABU0A463_9BACI|nr:2-amino-4-hydroxy-6-hydroxymethyldihydropteridine diphosphokinase [Evansella vedderi]MDQ0257889.1 2-amino-4-hydroxy-6-hydroxymethyldihydropteridine diphosphokinase [Evansella vedderi]
MDKVLKKRVNEVYISLGSNMEDREGNLYTALEQLKRESQIQVMKVSSIYETAPVGYTDQSSFLNLVIKLETTFSPLELLDKLQEIEQFGGRKRVIRWGPRTIDLDILLFNHENINLEQLHVPHPRMFERGFVLIPFREIAPNYTFNDGTTIEQYIDQLTDKEGVQKWKSSSGEDASGHSEN